jgi:hypothetical protein
VVSPAKRFLPASKNSLPLRRSDPSVIDIGIEPFSPADFGHRLFTLKSFQDNADFFFSRELASGLALNVFDNG